MKRNKQKRQGTNENLAETERNDKTVTSAPADRPQPEKERVPVETKFVAETAVDSSPIRDRVADDTAKPVVSASYGRTKIEVFRRGTVTELVIDGKVYAEHKGAGEDNYGISARYRGVDITSEYRNQFLYFTQSISVNGKIVAETQNIL